MVNHCRCPHNYQKPRQVQKTKNKISLNKSYKISLSANITKWSNTLKQFIGNYLSVFDHFVGLVLKVLKEEYQSNKHFVAWWLPKNEENEGCRISIHEKKKLHFCIAQMGRLMTESSPIPTTFLKVYGIEAKRESVIQLQTLLEATWTPRVMNVIQ